MNIDIKTLPYTNAVSNIMLEAKKKELLQVADVYGVSLEELKDIINKELLESGANVGACDTAVDFLIVETINRSKRYNSIEDAIGENILSASIYYVNGIEKTEYV